MQSPNPIADLWRRARDYFARMRTALSQSADQRAWLRPLEAMVRKIVLLEAAKLARAPEPPKPKPQKLPPLVLSIYVRPAPPPYPEPRPHKPRFRLWPRQAPPPVRIRSLAPPTLVRDLYRERFREAQARQLNMTRFMRADEATRVAGRITALERILAKPIAAVRRLARKLRGQPKFALRLAVTRWPRSAHADHDTQNLLSRECYFAALALNDTS
jgi:hypothetical protein